MICLGIQVYSSTSELDTLKKDVYRELDNVRKIMMNDNLGSFLTLSHLTKKVEVLQNDLSSYVKLEHNNPFGLESRLPQSSHIANSLFIQYANAVKDDFASMIYLPNSLEYCIPVKNHTIWPFLVEELATLKTDERDKVLQYFKSQLDLINSRLNSSLLENHDEQSLQEVKNILNVSFTNLENLKKYFKELENKK